MHSDPHIWCDVMRFNVKHEMTAIWTLLYGYITYSAYMSSTVTAPFIYFTPPLQCNHSVIYPALPQANNLFHSIPPPNRILFNPFRVNGTLYCVSTDLYTWINLYLLASEFDIYRLLLLWVACTDLVQTISLCCSCTVTENADPNQGRAIWSETHIAIFF